MWWNHWFHMTIAHRESIHPQRNHSYCAHTQLKKTDIDDPVFLFSRIYLWWQTEAESPRLDIVALELRKSCLTIKLINWFAALVNCWNCSSSAGFLIHTDKTYNKNAHKFQYRISWWCKRCDCKVLWVIFTI